MRYLSFTIRNYRAITGPLRIDVQKSFLNPIIGINESGKTTILHAICAFDCWNDELNDNGRHLKDTTNLYSVSSRPATVAAEIQTTASRLKQEIADAAADDDNAAIKEQLLSLSRKRSLPSEVTITRNIPSGKYSIDPATFGSANLADAVARQVISRLPYILYFDDFRDKIPGRIEIPPSKNSPRSEWLGIIQELFQQTDKNFNVFDLARLEERARKSVLAKVQRKLNGTLTKEWQTFRLDDRDALKVSIDFEREQVIVPPPPTPAPPPSQSWLPPPQQNPQAQVSPPVTVVKNYIKLDVVELDRNGDDHFFFISDRSKGFYWFFNFVMKLEFNPKVVSNEAKSIYLLDEPGSYLHAFAQRKLCQKLRQISERNWVAYCTHSHYLLDPEVIPPTRILIADKDGDGAISLIPMSEYPSSTTEKRSALQPVLDALQIKPFALDIIGSRGMLIVEGIYDYFCLEMFRGERNISILPSVGADSIKYFVSLLVAWQIEFRALWDNDPEGRKKREEAARLFGDTISERSLKLLPFGSAEGRFIIQNLFDGRDLALVRSELEIDPGCSFERTIQNLFYSKDRARILERLDGTTHSKFSQVFESLSL